MKYSLYVAELYISQIGVTFIKPQPQLSLSLPAAGWVDCAAAAAAATVALRVTALHGREWAAGVRHAVVRVSAGFLLRPRIPGVRVLTPIMRSGLNAGLGSGGRDREWTICVGGRRVRPVERVHFLRRRGPSSRVVSLGPLPPAGPTVFPSSASACPSAAPARAFASCRRRSSAGRATASASGTAPPACQLTGLDVPPHRHGAVDGAGCVHMYLWVDEHAAAVAVGHAGAVVPVDSPAAGDILPLVQPQVLGRSRSRPGSNCGARN